MFYRYRITEGVNLPFRVLPTIKELGRTRIEVNVKVIMLVHMLKFVDVLKFYGMKAYMHFCTSGKECFWCQDVCPWGCHQNSCAKTNSKNKFSSDIGSSEIQCCYRLLGLEVSALVCFVSCDILNCGQFL